MRLPPLLLWLLGLLATPLAQAQTPADSLLRAAPALANFAAGRARISDRRVRSFGPTFHYRR